MAKKVDWTKYSENRHSFRINDFIGNLLDKEMNMAEFARSAVTNLYEKDVMIQCPTCEGAGAIHGHKPVSARKTKKRRSRKEESNKEKVLTMRCDDSLTRRLNEEKNKTELILMAIVLATSERQEMECPTCKGAGKVIGGPSVRKKLVKKS